MSDVLDRLEEHLSAATRPEGEVYRDDWRIEDDDAAAWASRKLRDAHREMNRIDAWAEKQIDRIREVAAEEKRQHERDADWFQTHLQLWLQELIAEGRAKKSIALPGGKLAMRKRQPKIEVEDEESFIVWLHTAGRDDLVKVKESIDKAALKKSIAIEGTRAFLADTGEVLEGVLVEPQEDSVTFSPVEEEE